MPTFAYQAADVTGRDTSGTIEAPDRAAAVRLLTGKGLQPFKIAEGNGKAAAKLIAGASAKTGKGKTAKGKADAAGAEADTGPIKLSGSQLQQFTEEMAELLEAGMRLEPALKLLEGKGTESPHRRIAKRLGDMIREGHPFSSALRAASPSFGELYCAVAAAGEAGGSLGVALRRQAMYLGSVREMRSQATVALIYPSFLLISAIGVVLLFTMFLIPRLSVLMSSIKGGAPKGIQIILSLSEFMKQWWWLLLAGTALLILAFIVWTKSKTGKPIWDKAKLKLPFLGNVLTATFHTQFLETLASLSTGGLPLLKGLELASRVSSNLYVQKQLEGVILSVRDGASLSRAMEKTALFPARLLEMVRIGEHTGEIANALRRTADRCGRDLAKSLERAMALMQPVIILVMAGLVGVMAYMMISVIFETISSLRKG